MLKKIFLFSLMIVIASCGSKNGPGASSSPREEGDVRPVDVSSCKVKFRKGDTPAQIALLANEARVSCKLGEEQVMELLKMAE